jgi:D-3-phosphoglycerate dehydrogenase
MKEKVLIGPSSFAALDRSPMERLVEGGFDVVNNPFGRKLTKQELMELLLGVKGLIAGLETLDEEVMRKSELKVISRCGSGISNVDIRLAEKLGIKVYCTPFGPTRAVAELTLGCLLTLIRQVPQMDQALHQSRWDKRIGRQLKGMRVLIVGYGRIGKAVGDLLKAFEGEVLICDPAYSEHDGYPRSMDLHSALPQADVITLHCDGEEQILGPREFSLLKPGVFLLNAARGGLIDEAALRQALDSGQVAGAWLDTFGKEPYDGPLSQYQQIILTPHIGSYTYEGRLQMEMEAVTNLLRGFREIEER